MCITKRQLQKAVDQIGVDCITSICRQRWLGLSAYFIVFNNSIVNESIGKVICTKTFRACKKALPTIDGSIKFLIAGSSIFEVASFLIITSQKKQ